MHAAIRDADQRALSPNRRPVATHARLDAASLACTHSRMAEHLALLDFGSNAVRFVLARVRPDGYRVLDQSRVRTRLAAGPRGELSEPAMEQSLRAAARFLRRVRGKDPRIMAVATASVRDAPNAAGFIARLYELGAGELRVLSGLEEARLGAEAALRALPLHDGAVIDLGGGSLQWTSVRDRRLGHALSLPLGAARMTREFIRHDPPQPRELVRLRESAREQLAIALPGSRPHGHLIVLGGTARHATRTRRHRRRGCARARTVDGAKRLPRADDLHRQRPPRRALARSTALASRAEITEIAQCPPPMAADGWSHCDPPSAIRPRWRTASDSTHSTYCHMTVVLVGIRPMYKCPRDTY
jgi:hypothetical protein